MKQTKSGFTIVELLIVIVVIAILAAISIVAYTGIQQRAKNAATVQSVQSWMQALTVSYTEQGTIQTTRASGDNSICLGYESEYPASNGLSSGQCYTYAHTNDTLMSELEKVANISTSVIYTDDFRGLQYGFDFESTGSRGGFIWYDLFGDSQDCVVPGSTVFDTGWGFTTCMIDTTEVIGGTPITWPGED